MATAGEWVTRCEQAFDAAGVRFGHGTDNARDEAAWLVLYVMGEPVNVEFTRWDRELDAGTEARLRELLDARLRRRQPLAYLLGEAWFCGLAFEVTPAVLVPRSPLAELIVDGFRPWLHAGATHRALDMCTGSGCIAVAMARRIPGLRVDAVDVSEAALQVAQRNVTRHGVADRVSLHRSDGFNAMGRRQWDLVVCNPPYVARDVHAALPAEYLAEPELGLVSGADGLDLPLRLLTGTARHLAPGGRLFMEVGESAQRLQDLLPGVPFTWIEFEHGGEGVFTMDRDELDTAGPALAALMEERMHVR